MSNTPLRELLQAHHEYWKDLSHKEKIPDLEIYIINVHPSKMDIDILPSDYDGIVDRDHDILFGDRTSLYDKISSLMTDYTNFATSLKNLAEEVISKATDKDNREELDEKLKAILSTKTISKDRKDEARAFHDLLKESFKMTKVVRIERTNYINSISGKTGDLTFETIHKLIREGECDAWFSAIHENIKNIRLDDKHTYTYEIQDKLIDKLNEAMRKLRKNDYEDCDSKVCHCLTEFIHIVKKEDKSEPYQSAKLVKYAEAFIDML